MAIQRVSGNILQDNLQRGANLSIQGNLAYFDVTNNRVGILTGTPQDEFNVIGVANASNVRITSATANGVFYAGNTLLALTNSGFTYDGINVNVTANLTAGNLISEGAVIGNVEISGNLTVNNLTVLDTLSGNIITATGNVTGANLVSNAGIYSQTANVSGNVNAGNVNVVSGVYSSTGFFTGNVDVLGNLNATIGVVYANSGIFYGNSVTGNNAAFAGIPGFTQLGSNVVMQFAGNVNSYSQLNFQNINNGTLASTDFVATADNGTDTTNYVNLGINSSTFNDPTNYPGYGPNDSYVHNHGGNLILNPESVGTTILLMVGGTDTANVVANVSSTGIEIYGLLDVSGNASVGNILTDGYYYANGAPVDFQQPAGANTEIQYNFNSDFGASANLTYNQATNIFQVGYGNGGNIQTDTLTVTGTITGDDITAQGNIQVNGDAIIDGNLTVNGDLVYNNVTSLNIEDPIISMGRGANNTPLTTNDGKDRGEQLWYFSSVEKSAFIGYDNSTGNLLAAVDVSIANEIVTVNQYGTWQIGNLYGQSALITGNVDAANISSTGNILAIGNVIAGNVISSGAVIGNVQITGNLTVANLTVTDYFLGNIVNISNTITALGNIQGGNLISNASVSAGTTVNATGNVTGGNLVSNASISAATTISATGNITGGNLVSNANISASNAVFANGNITGGNIISNGFVSVATTVSATGNITGGNLVSNAAISATTTIDATGNITGGNLVSNASISAATTVNATGNITGGNLVSNASVSAATTINATGNITGGNLVSNANISAASFIFATGNIVGGNIISNARIVGTTLDIYGDGLIAGNLTVQGNLTYINIDDLRVEDPIIQLGGGANGNALVTNDGKDRGTLLTYYTTAPGNAFMGWDNPSGNMIIANDVSIANDIITVNSFGTLEAGNIYAESAIIAGNVSFGNISTPGQINATGNITGGNLVSNANISAASFIFATANVVGGNIVSNANISAATAIFANNNITGGNLVSNGFVSVSTTVNATGNITGGNLVSNANISASNAIFATGNITGGNVVSNAAISATTTISATGNVTGGNIVSNALITGSNVQVTSLTTNRVVYVGADDYLVDSGNFTFDGGNANIQGQLIVDNFTIDGTVISSNANATIQSSSNGNIDITPNGTGVVNINNIAIADNTISSTTGNIIVDPAANIVLPDELANSVLYLTAGKEIETSANLTFDGANLILLGSANIDNIRIDGTGITSNANLSITATSGNILLTPGSTGVTQISSTTALTMPVGNTAQRPASPDQGAVRFNSTNLVLEVWDGTQWDVVGQDLAILTSQVINGDGSQVAFTLNEITTSSGILVSINGVSQIPDVSYGVTGNVITFSEAPQVSDAVEVRFLTQLQTVTEITNTSGNAAVGVSATASQVNITGNLLPTANVTYDLGSSALRWKDGYFSGNSITLGNIVLKNITGNTLAFFGPDGTTPGTLSSNNVDTTSIANGTSNVQTLSSGSVTVSANGNANVVVVANGSVTVKADILNGQANGVGNIGSSSTYFNTVFAKATSAQYADLAEQFECDQTHDTGTVMVFAGNNEITKSTQYADQRLAGIISTDPAYVMNATQANSVPIAMAGRVPCWVVGPVAKGDVLTTSSTAGHAEKLKNTDWLPGVIVGKALESAPAGSHKIMVVVGAW
jgi:filamentous hemagglutinin